MFLVDDACRLQKASIAGLVELSREQVDEKKSLALELESRATALTVGFFVVISSGWVVAVARRDFCSNGQVLVVRGCPPTSEIAHPPLKAREKRTIGIYLPACLESFKKAAAAVCR